MEPGWYNDPSSDAHARWHDGQNWTQHVVVKANWRGLGTPPPPEDAASVPASSHTRERRAGRIRSRSLAFVAVAALVAAIGAGAWLNVRSEPREKAAAPSANRSASQAMPEFSGSHRELKVWLNGDGAVIVNWLTESQRTAELGTAAAPQRRKLCDAAQRQLEAAAPRPSAIEKAAGSASDWVVRELVANDVHAKVDLLRSCLGDLDIGPHASEVAGTHAALKRRLALLRELVS